MEELVAQVAQNKKYSFFSKEFIREITQSVARKRQPIKEARRKLHEISSMYSGVRTEKEAREVWQFLSQNLSLKELSVLDAGAGEFPRFYPIASEVFRIKSYDALDVSSQWHASFPSQVNFEQDDVLSPQGKWTFKHYNLCLALNVVPVLEKIRPGAGSSFLRLLEQRASFTLLSLPMRSLGGRKFIGGHWLNWVEQNIDASHVAAKQEGNELLVLLKNQTRK
ncbi:hypothetical protein AUJ65_03560 [Candidatus Micrarchaeota archaeon CG1_02_51_15]|nr:MAG: hypothetical protein AUJ65_03560 [Candidatus Micrarchaeota archaeon CG1_02_51_15]